MNERLQNKLIEVVGANNVSYIMNDNNDFSVTGYKVMKNKNNSGLLRCAKILYNGKIKLVYIVDGSKPLSYVATRLGVNELNAVVFNLIQRAMDIKANGFFRAENLELDFNKIFVDTSDFSVRLIYFPISGGPTGKVSSFDNEFRVSLIKLLNSFPVFNAPQFQRLCSDLSNGSLSLEDILKKLQDTVNNGHYAQQPAAVGKDKSDYGVQMAPPVGPGHMGGFANNNQAYQAQGYQVSGYQTPGIQNPGYQPGAYQNAYGSGRNEVAPRPNYAAVQPVRQPVLTITAINSPVALTLTVDQPEYLIGKNPNMVNGAVLYNPAISRVHCKISYAQGRYYLTDLGSANGTYANYQKIESHQTIELHSGDYIKLANSDFIISF